MMGVEPETSTPTPTNATPTNGGGIGVSLLCPTFLRQLLAPEIRTVLVLGCGGGFDFVHSMLLYPELRRLGKKVVIVSNSFGSPREFAGSGVETVLEEPQVKLVDATATHMRHYAPEIHLLSFLDQEWPVDAPHSLYACYARDWCEPKLSAFLQQVADQHSVDAVLTMDGGTDSLMVGDESGLGDPIEDAVSVAACAKLGGSVRLHLLIAVGFGCDRFNRVTDAASMRAVAELTAAGGYRGCISLELTGVPGEDSEQSGPMGFYKRCVQHIYARQVLFTCHIHAMDSPHGSSFTHSCDRLSHRL